MAIKVTAISVGVTAAFMAASATAAEPAAEGSAEESAHVDAPEPLRLDGWSCISRGPLAPPPLPADFEALLGRVPA